MPIGDLYNIGQLIDKTLIAFREVPVYDSPPDINHVPVKIATVHPGNPVGVVYSYLGIDPSKNRPVVWLQFAPDVAWGHWYYTPFDGSLFDLSAFQQQGVLSVIEQAAQDAEDNKEWYEKVLDRVLPIAVVVLLGSAAIRGYLSRGK